MGHIIEKSSWFVNDSHRRQGRKLQGPRPDGRHTLRLLVKDFSSTRLPAIILPLAFHAPCFTESYTFIRFISQTHTKEAF